MTIHRNTFLAALTALALGAGATAALAGTKSPPVNAVESDLSGSLGDQLATLANDVNLSAWTRIAASQDFRTIEESWVAVYSPKDAVGTAQDWNAQLKMARTLAHSTSLPAQQRWLARFIEASEAVAHKDSGRFAIAVRSLENELFASQTALAANQNIFTAK
jgi:hypothetical protein